MCLAIPGRVVAIDAGSHPLTGSVEFGGIRKTVCLEYVPDIRIGEYVITHVGFAISRIDEEEALATLTLFREAGQYGEEAGE